VAEETVIGSRRRRQRSALEAVCVVIVANWSWIARSIVPSRVSQACGAKTYDRREEERDRSSTGATMETNVTHELLDCKPDAGALSKNDV
jgi:hypothetical protein